ncbi:E3 ubiquitin-protein ligase hrd1, partial [Serendipita sp. 399]
MFTYTLDAVMQKGIGLGVLFTTEYAILLVGLTQCIMKYVLTMIDIRRAASIGGATAPPWEQKPIYGFYIELSTAFIELAIYLTYFTLMSIYHSIPVYAIRDVYVSGSLFFSRSLAFIRYKRAMQALHAFPTPTQKELDSKSDNTCIVCREELVAPSIGSAASPAPNQNEQVGEPATQPSGSAPSNEPDSSNGPPKRLPCGHIFHLNCLRSWFERQLTCPTCRRKVDETLPRAPGPAGAAGGQPGAPGNNGARDAGRPGADVGGANPGAVRRPGNNPGTGAAPTDTPTQMKEPLKFEGFYLQANCFVPWAGGPVLPRDPTQPFPPQRQPAQLQRHRQYPGPPSASPTPTVQSPSQPTQPLAPFGAGLANAATTASIPEPVDLKNSDEEDTSSDDSTTQLIGSIQERRRIAAEAALKRHQAGRSSTPSTPTPTQKAAAGPSNLGTPLSSSELNQLMERNLNKYFT